MMDWETITSEACRDLPTAELARLALAGRAMAEAIREYRGHDHMWAPEAPLVEALAAWDAIAPPSVPRGGTEQEQP